MTAWMSMTGFGRGEAHDDEASVSVDVRSVNHRYMDAHIRCPVKFLAWEARIRAQLRETVRRGKLDVFVNVREWGRGSGTVRVNRGLLGAFLAAAEEVRRESGVSGELTVRDLLRVPDLFVFPSEGVDPEEARWPLAERALGDALGILAASRREEGRRLAENIREGIGELRGIAEEIAGLASENREAARARFRERIGSLAGEAGVDPSRLHQEAAFLIDRLDITEEIQRLSSHVAGLSALLENPPEAVGKRFDFLLQEAFRELTTAANKSAHAGLSSRAVDAKNVLERIREQIQNVE